VKLIFAGRHKGIENLISGIGERHQSPAPAKSKKLAAAVDVAMASVDDRRWSAASTRHDSLLFGFILTLLFVSGNSRQFISCFIWPILVQNKETNERRPLQYTRN
jgi:hypothetical protein